MVIVDAINILFIVSALHLELFKISQGSGHVNAMVFLYLPTLILCNKRVITPKVEHAHCSVYHHELWQGNSPGEYLLVAV